MTSRTAAGDTRLDGTRLAVRIDDRGGDERAVGLAGVLIAVGG
jgi:hypothetical protein